MPLVIDDETAALVHELAALLKINEQAAVKGAVQAELDRLLETSCFDQKLEAFYSSHPLPPQTGEVADKAFFDELSGEFN